MQEADFYDAVAGFYDEMTGFEARLESSRPVIRSLLGRYGGRQVIDVACGTGLHAVLFAEEGLGVTAADISEQMLQRAQAHAEEHRVQVRFIRAPMQELRHAVTGGFDLLVCLGNSLPHVTSQHDLMQALFGFAAVLRRSGIAIIQLLNYYPILRDRKRIVDIRKKADHEFIRFYDFGDTTITFNVLRIRWENGIPAHQLECTELYPYLQEDLKSAMNEAGLVVKGIHGSLMLEPFDPERSPNLVVAAGKT